MRTILLRSLWLAVAAAGVAYGQNSDLGFLLGGSIAVNSRTSPDVVTSRVSAAGQINYAIQLHETRAGQLYLELPLILAGGVRSSVTSGTVTGSVEDTIFFTPGVRWKFSPANRVSFYAAIGGGIGSFGQNIGVVGNRVSVRIGERETTAALGFGGGIDFRLTRLISLRAEGRDGVTRGNIDGSANHTFFMVGAALHF